jgi:hypothetical protein
MNRFPEVINVANLILPPAGKAGNFNNIALQDLLFTNESVKKCLNRCRLGAVIQYTVAGE